MELLLAFNVVQDLFASVVLYHRFKAHLTRPDIIYLVNKLQLIIIVASFYRSSWCGTLKLDLIRLQLQDIIALHRLMYK